jgi:hypothetical protein
MPMTGMLVPMQDKEIALPTSPVEVLGKLVEMHFAAWSMWINVFQDASRFRRREFAHTEIQKFMNDPLVHNAMLMMDWRERIIVLTDEQATFLGDKKFSYHEDTLPNTLSAKPSFTLEETIVRDCFDAFFTRIEQFYDLVATGMMEYADFKPFLAYWAELLSGKIAHKNPAVIAALESYIAEYFDKTKVRAFLDAVQ